MDWGKLAYVKAEEAERYMRKKASEDAEEKCVSTVCCPHAELYAGYTPVRISGNRSVGVMASLRVSAATDIGSAKVAIECGGKLAATTSVTLAAGEESRFTMFFSAYPGSGENVRIYSDVSGPVLEEVNFLAVGAGAKIAASGVMSRADYRGNDIYVMCERDGYAELTNASTETTVSVAHGGTFDLAVSVSGISVACCDDGGNTVGVLYDFELNELSRRYLDSGMERIAVARHPSGLVLAGIRGRKVYICYCAEDFSDRTDWEDTEFVSSADDVYFSKQTDSPTLFIRRGRRRIRQACRARVRRTQLPQDKRVRQVRVRVSADRKEREMEKKRGITVRNLYTVRVGNETVGGYNEAVPDFYKLAFATASWAKYFAVTREDGTLVSFETKLESVNCDPSRGMPRATYSGEFTTTQGVKYKRVSLFRSQDPSGEMSGSDIAFEGDGGVAYITATVNIIDYCEEGNLKFCSGDNPLLKIFLGCGTFSQYKFGWGECDFPSKICSRDVSRFGTLLRTSAMAKDGTVTFLGGAAGTGKEVVLFWGTQAVMRAVLPFTYSVKAFGETVASGTGYKRFASTVSNSVPEAILNVTVDSNPVVAPDICPEYSRADELKTDFGIALGSGGYVTSDPSGKFVAAVSNGYVDVYRADVPMLERVTRVKRTDEYAEVLRSGAVALWSKTSLKIYAKDDGERPAFTMAVNNPSQKCVLKVGAYYHAMYDEGNTFKRIKIDPDGNVTVLETRTVSNKSRWFICRCGDYIAYGSDTLYVKSLDSDESSDFSCSSLSSASVPRTVCGVGDCFCVCNEGGVTAVYDFVTGTRTVLPLSEARCAGKLVYGGGKVYAFSYGGGLKEITCDEDMSGVTSAAIAGDGLYAVTGGKLKVFYLSKAALTMRVPNYAAGKILRGAFKERVLSGSGKKASFVLTVR